MTGITPQGTGQSWPATLEQLEQVIAVVENEATLAGIVGSRRSGLLVAVEEAFVNICHYAYPDGAGNITINCTRGNDRLVVELIDEGVPFDILSLPEPDTKAGLQDREPGGLGVHFIRKLTDKVSYHHRNGQNILQMELCSNKD